ncbi:hypothetical protein F442_22114 [Phytophthora nicotianae P10297]|uniref:Uncharacterized protein n=1 Tax=Phytophthora nicotianae P10297 TaxID=1317064 RepID=W2Y346_PHYNI|nr:hypothetical protein F442_22114 [Phytophthora nicotianae P10297]
MKRRSLQLPERNATPQNQVISFPQCPGQCQNLTYALHEVLRQLAKSSIAHQRSIAVLTLYSCMTPLGIFLGMVLSDSLRGSSALTMEVVALSIASGSFIYLAFHELFRRERKPRDQFRREARAVLRGHLQHGCAGRVGIK